MKNSDYMYISIKSKLQTITDHLRKPVQVNVKEKKKKRCDGSHGLDSI